MIKAVTAMMFAYLSTGVSEKFECSDIGIHRSGQSPLFGVDREDLALVLKTMQQEPVLEKLGRAIREDHYDNFRWTIPVEKQNEADSIAKELFQEYIAPFRQYGCSEDNIVSWETEKLEDSSNCMRYSTVSNGWESWEESTPHVLRKNPAFHEQSGRYISPWTVARHELQHTREIDSRKDHLTCSKEDLYGEEILTTVQDILDNSYIYERIYDRAEDSTKVILIGNKAIRLERFAAFYRELKIKYGSLAQAITSPESIAFLSLNADEDSLISSCPHMHSSVSLTFQYRKFSDSRQKHYIKKILKLLENGISCNVLSSINHDKWVLQSSAILTAIKMGIPENVLVRCTNTLEIIESHSEIIKAMLENKEISLEEITEPFLLDLAHQQYLQKLEKFEKWMQDENQVERKIEGISEDLAQKLSNIGISSHMLAFLSKNQIEVLGSLESELFEWIQKGGSFSTLAALEPSQLMSVLMMSERTLQLLSINALPLIFFDIRDQRIFLNHKDFLMPLIEEGKIDLYKITHAFLDSVDTITAFHQKDNLMRCLKNGIIPIEGFLDRLDSKLAFDIIKHIEQTEFLAKEGLLSLEEVEVATDSLGNHFSWRLDDLNIELTKRLLEKKELLNIDLDLKTILKLQGSGVVPRLPLKVIVELLEAGELDGAEWVATSQISGSWFYDSMPASAQRAFYGSSNSQESKPMKDREFTQLSEGAQSLLGVHTKQPSDYEVLGISASATAQEIKDAYKKTMLRCHPDKNPDNPHAQEVSIRINEAWDALKP